jgi:excinuclease ABC subunit C
LGKNGSREGCGVLRPLVDEIRSFEGFGPCLLASDGEPPAAELVRCADARATRKLIRQRVAPAPGVYGMISAEGELIYVGKSRRLRDRLVSYFSGGSPPSKAQRIIRHTQRLVFEKAPGELAALLRELELIRRWRPRYNVRGQPRRMRKAYLCLGRGPAAHAYLAGKPSRRADVLFGPVRGGRHARRLVRLLNDCFGLRDCAAAVPILFSDQRELFAQKRPARCLRHEFGTCLGPCVGACSSREYAERVAAARDFLVGRDRSVLRRLEHEMRSAAGARQFERAASLRDTWEALGELAGQLRRLREVRRRYTFVYPMAGYGGEAWCLIRHGHVVAATDAPGDAERARRGLELIGQVYGEEGGNGAGQTPEDLDMLQLVASWFQHRPEELARTLSPEDAAGFCRARACPSGREQL